MDIKEKYLPVGTVVLLKGAKEYLVIAGFAASDTKNPGTTYDYIGIAYPEGILDFKAFPMFNHDQIEKVIHLGLEDEIYNQFNTELKKELSQNIDNQE